MFSILRFWCSSCVVGCSLLCRGLSSDVLRFAVFVVVCYLLFVVCANVY